MERELPLLSIIIPVYNTEKFLRRCIDSVIRQTYPRIEIIVVNDASPDDSEAIITDYENRYNNIVYVKNETNEGLFQARLRGYEKASGTYIASLDSDDFVGADYYRIQMTKAIESAADVVISMMTVYYQDDGKKTQRTYGNYAVRDLELCGEEIARTYFSMDAEVSQWWFVWNKVYKKELWDKCYKTFSLYEGHHIMLEDFVYGTVFMTHADKVVSVENNNYYYVRHDEASTGKGGGALKIKKNVNDILDAFDFLKKYLDEKCKTNEGLVFLDKACRRWKKTWLDSVAKADIEDKDREEIVSQLEKIPVQTVVDPNDNIYAGYFYREISSCSEEINQLKECLRNPKIKILCIETDNILFENVWNLDELLNNVEKKWRKNNKEDISEIIFARKWSERMLFRERADVYKSNISSLQEIYDGIKKIGNTEYNQLVDRVCGLEEEVNRTYLFKLDCMDEVISFARWLGKKLVLVNTSRIQIEIDGFDRIYTLNKNTLSNLCHDFECDTSEIIYLGTDQNVDLARLDQLYGVECHKVSVPNDISFKNNLHSEIVLGSQRNGGINGIKKLLLKTVREKSLYRKVSNSIFLSDPCLIGEAVGSHIVSVVGWLLNLALKKGKKEICFWGDNVDSYYHSMKYVLETQKTGIDVSVSYKTFCRLEKALEWVIFPETFVQYDAVIMDVTVSELFDMLSAFIGDIYDNVLRKYGIVKEDYIDNYELCERLHCILDFDFDVLHQVEKEYFDDLGENVLVVCADKNAERVLKRYTEDENVFAFIYQDMQSGLLKEKETYYSTEKIIDYPIRPFLLRDIFRITSEEIYSKRFVAENIKKGIRKYIDAYFDLFREDFIEFLPLYSEQDSYYFEKFIHYPENNDRLLFDVIQQCDCESRKIRLLSNIWWEKLNIAQLLKKKEETRREGGGKEKSQKVAALDKTAIYYAGERVSFDALSKLDRQMVYWVFDKRKINYKVRKYRLASMFMSPFLKVGGRKIKRDKHCLYIATSNYNLLCCIIHKLKYNAEKDCDLFLSIWRKDKVGFLKAEGIFNTIYISEDNHFRNMTRELDERIKHASKKEKDYLVEGFYDRFCDELPMNLFEYKNILATNTVMPITVVLQKLHLQYDCVEEAAGLYSNNELLLNNMRNFHPKSEMYALEKYKMLNMDHVKGKRFVNISAQEPGFSRRNVVDFNVISELKKMDSEKRAKVLNIFSATEAAYGESKLSCLMLTYPLASRSGLTEKEHIEVYRLLMDIFCQDRVVHFKPHPDDPVDYTKYFRNEPDFRLINKQILSELLEFETKTKYQKAITTVSTSTNNLQNCEEKIVFGKEFEQEYKNLLLCYGYFLMAREMDLPEDYVVYFKGLDGDIVRNIFNYSSSIRKKYTICDDYEKAVNEVKPKMIIMKGNLDCSVIKETDVAIISNSDSGYEEMQKSHMVMNVVMDITGREDINRYKFKVLMPRTLIQPKELHIVEKLARCGYEISMVKES